ncbi:MAG: polysaccharide biosynthesis/export family protein [Edaphobacter sp.]|uniref:polysaccharide biosynthesis/export family protein n=1 Tax=Edaphobacter sp. TaxID=1934404 RepID=UPI0023A72224|nr:polysaccharide biosynthesis/export family protein [Edaphobacter sp.]MDE1175183.1 polysaccharide biosynthesis/export family protein [Edaphobacter sp.]
MTCFGQDTPAPAPELKQNPIALLKAFEGPADQPYQLGRGDEITVEVIGRPELTSKHIVGPDGKITLPVVGSVMVADKTREQAAADIQTALSTYYSGVTVSVGVDHYSSNHILLLGAVEHPGLLTFDTTPTLLEVISRGGQLQAPSPMGGASSGAGASAGVNSALPMGVPEECMIYRGNATMVTVQLKSLLEEGSPLANMRLKRDDVVFVPGPDKYVSVMGMVTKPGTQRLDSKSTLPQILAMAGGVTEKAGRSPTIQVIHRGTEKSPGKTQLIAYKDILSPKPLDLTLQSGDIVYIPESGFNKAGYTFQTLSPLVSLFTVGALLH